MESSLNLSLLAHAFPGEPDLVKGVIAGRVAFCTSPEVILGSVGDLFIREPDVLRGMQPPSRGGT